MEKFAKTKNPAKTIAELQAAGKLRVIDCNPSNRHSPWKRISNNSA